MEMWFSNPGAEQKTKQSPKLLPATTKLGKCYLDLPKKKPRKKKNTQKVPNSKAQGLKNHPKSKTRATPKNHVRLQAAGVKP